MVLHSPSETPSSTLVKVMAAVIGSGGPRASQADAAMRRARVGDAGKEVVVASRRAAESEVRNVAVPGSKTRFSDPRCQLEISNGMRAHGS